MAHYDDAYALLNDGKMFGAAQFWPELVGSFDPVPEQLPVIATDHPNHLPLSDEVDWMDSYFARSPHMLPARFKFRE